MAVTVCGVEDGSIAQQLHIMPGDKLLTVNGHAIHDVLDYGFYTASDVVTLELEMKDGGTTVLEVETGGEDLGIQSESFLMDQQHRCRNNCIFCFIDQLPKGLRESLYFKDDDERLSFLFGNYITLTNLGDAEINRVIDMHISPINISVHTTDPELRCRMMGNRFAGEKLQYIYKLAAAGTQMNCQIVLCRDVNDGAALEKTLTDLVALYPAVRSVACVPVGLTAHREGLEPLKPYDRQAAAAVLDIIDRFHAQSRETHGTGLVYPADELLLLAGRDIPPISYYDDMLQLENGVGMLALLYDDFKAALDETQPTDKPLNFTIVTGELAAPAMRELAALAERKAHNLRCEVVAVKNEFLGGNVSVAGLLTAQDIYKQLTKCPAKGAILITSCMLRSEGDLFLDSVSVAQLAEMLGREIMMNNDGAQLARILMGG